MPLPLLIAIPALVAAGLGGTAVGGVGVYNMNEAKNRCDAARTRHEEALAAFRIVEAHTQDLARSYGHRQVDVQLGTLGAWLSGSRTTRRRCVG